jgi:hypothetical protein
MPLGLQQQDSDLAFAQSTTTSGGSTTATSDFAPSPEHRHAAWTGRRSESSRSGVGPAKEQNMTAQDVDVETEGRPPYLHVRSNHQGLMGRTAERFRPVRLRNALTWDSNDRP